MRRLIKKLQTSRVCPHIHTNTHTPYTHINTYTYILINKLTIVYNP